MKKLLFNIHDFIQVLETLRDEAGTEEIIVSEHDGYPSIADAADPSTILILKPADDSEEDNSELH